MAKTLSLFGMGILALFLCLTFVSAAITFSDVPTLEQNGSSATITITSDIDESVTFTLDSITEDGKTVTFSNPSGVSLTAGTPENITISYSVPSDFEFDLQKTYSTTLTVTGATSGNTTQSISFEESKFCEYNNPGKLDVKEIDIVNKGIGEDDVWYPYDVLEVEVEIENDGSEDVEDIALEWGVYDSDGEWIIEPVDEDDFDLDEDDEDTITFEIDLDDDLDVDLEDLSDGSYDLYVRVTGERKDSNDMTCASDSENIDIKIEDDYVILRNIEIVGTPFCGSMIQVKAEVVNIGEDDQEDVEVSIYNKELGINEYTILEDLDAFEDKNLVFELSIPTDLEEKTYSLLLQVFDDGGDIYESSEDDLSEYDLPLAVSGNCVREAEATVYASLESGGKAGQEMQIRASITNTDSSEQTFTIKAADYSDWAELVSIEPSTLTIDEDEEQDVIITLNVDSDSPEDVSFSIIVEDENENTVTQPVSVTIEKGFSLKGLLGDKGYVWGIILLNAILIIVIIVVAIRVARR